ncbi:MAG: hypothetical protein ACETWG_07330 [Candidatus Neomarinimicrobiota bacterium]
MAGLSAYDSSDCYAAIDLGTNTCLLLIARWDGTRLVPLAQELRTIRLGAGVDKTGQLSQEAISRAALVFKEYQRLIDSYNCHRVRCVATSAFREASNKEVLHRRIKDTTGYSITELSGREEAELVLRAVQHASPSTQGSRAIVDVGGGSTELILEKDRQLADSESLPLGSVRLTERWLHHDPPSPEELAAAEHNISDIFTHSKLAPPVDTIVAVGGTATTLVAMHLGLVTYDHDRVHGATMTGSTLQKILARCSLLPLEKRLKLPGLQPGRAEVIIAGGLILQAIIAHFGLETVTVSDQGLRWGLVLEMVEQERPTAQTS